jgi:hypothetical protein
MHPLLAEQFAPVRLAELHHEAEHRRLIRSTRPIRSRPGHPSWWRRDRT